MLQSLGKTLSLPVRRFGHRAVLWRSCIICAALPLRYASSSSSSTRWKARQSKDVFSREAKVAGLKSRAAFKLLQINDKHRIFRRGQTVVDLGYAPGSWSQVAYNRCAPGGRVIGIDILPAQPPRGVSTIQGDFLSPDVQEEVRSYVRSGDRGRAKPWRLLEHEDGDSSQDEIELDARRYLEKERRQGLETESNGDQSGNTKEAMDDDPLQLSKRQKDEAAGRVVDVVLSDMSEPWDQVTGLQSRSISNQYHRLMNTSGVPFRDHAGSMDLCNAAVRFCFDTLKTGGHFICKFYQGQEDKALELRLKRLFEKVHREKPEASRKESREGFFVALRRRDAVTEQDVFRE